MPTIDPVDIRAVPDGLLVGLDCPDVEPDELVLTLDSVEAGTGLVTEERMVVATIDVPDDDVDRVETVFPCDSDVVCCTT